MRYYAVIDTNVLVSAMLKRNSVPGCILDAVIRTELSEEDFHIAAYKF